MLEMLTNAIEELDEDRVIKIVKRCMAAKIDPKEIWMTLNKGLERVGNRYETGEYSIADLMVVGIIFEDVLEYTNVCNIYDDIKDEVSGKSILLGTVEGDIHDIGKSIFKGAMQAGGFFVHDLGVDVKAEDFVEASKKYHCDIIGLSAVLTDCIVSIKEVVEAFAAAGMRDQVKIIIGGCVATKTVCDFVKADAYTKSAIKGVEICQRWLQNEQN
ncbi:MAG: cobalamin-dependent protein [Eubacterium sp.]|nr:cobalamin-dependent protein [Eubacterium sp.]